VGVLGKECEARKALLQILDDHRAVGEPSALIVLEGGNAAKRAPLEELRRLFERVGWHELVLQLLLREDGAHLAHERRQQGTIDLQHEGSFPSGGLKTRRAPNALLSTGRAMLTQAPRGPGRPRNGSTTKRRYQRFAAFLRATELSPENDGKG